MISFGLNYENHFIEIIDWNSEVKWIYIEVTTYFLWVYTPINTVLTSTANMPFIFIVDSTPTCSFDGVGEHCGYDLGSWGFGKFILQEITVQYFSLFREYMFSTLNCIFKS